MLHLRPLIRRSPLLSRALCTIDGAADTHSAAFEANAAAMDALVQQVREDTEKARVGGSAKAVALHRSRGKLLVRERIEALLDPSSPFLELSPLAAHDLYGDEYVPGAGLVSGVGLIAGRKCMVIANDPTTKGGTAYPMTVKK